MPETILSTASQGEKRLFNILKAELPENFIVWVEWSMFAGFKLLLSP